MGNMSPSWWCKRGCCFAGTHCFCSSFCDQAPEKRITRFVLWGSPMVPSMKHRWLACPSVRSAEPNGHPSHTRSRRALSWSRQPLASCDPSTPLSYHHGQGGCMEHLQFRLVRKKCHLSAFETSNVMWGGWAEWGGWGGWGWCWSVLVS